MLQKERLVKQRKNNMPQGKGTYGHKIGRPSKKGKAAKKVAMKKKKRY